MALTNSQIQTKVNVLERNIADIQNSLKLISDNVDSKIHLSEIGRLRKELKTLIDSNSNLIVDIEQRLAKIKLPDETKYYLEEGEVESFKNNFSQLKAMLSRFERLYNNLVAYGAQLGK